MSVQASQTLPSFSVPRTAPKPKKGWLAARVKTFLAHYWVPDQQLADEMLVLSDWVDVLGDLPQLALEEAFRERLRSANRTRPLPGEILEAAQRYLERPAFPALPPPMRPDRKYEPPQLDAEQQARAERALAEFRETGRVPKLTLFRTGDRGNWQKPRMA